MAFTQAQLTALDAAIAGGELTVKYEDKMVTYRSLEEMIRTRALIKADLAGSGGAATAPASMLGGRRVHLGFSSGLSSE